MAKSIRLTPEQRAQLNASAAEIQAAHAEVDRFERLGFDVSGHRDELNKAEAFRQAALSEFAPHNVKG